MNKNDAAQYLPLVQALADGKVIQYRVHGGGWVDDDHPAFTSLPCCYRIKPEPREIFFVEFSNGNHGPYATREIAEQNYPRSKVVRYREVLE